MYNEQNMFRLFYGYIYLNINYNDGSILVLPI